MVLHRLQLGLRLQLEQAAEANGFDVRRKSVHANWLAFSSSQVPLRIWLAGGSDETFFVALSHAPVARSLGGDTASGSPDSGDGEKCSTLPCDAVAVRAANGTPALHKLLRRAYKLSATLPDQLLRSFEKEVEAMPRSTEAERLVVQRVGQHVFRRGLIDYWNGRCALTGLDMPELLRASHIKPWSDCASDAERLDIHNGLLLAAHVDAAFDCGLLTFSNGGALVLASNFERSAVETIGLAHTFPPLDLRSEHQRYLDWHREHVFRG